jgi:predicted DNA-binding transcriptional regulator YafY
MRADRLLSLLMLLQTRGRMTAAELARELEVSVRTIYRDIEALSLSGVPVYTERGPGGGCALLDNYRTTLTGLTPAEVRALFALSIPAPLDDLGLAQELKTALLKLSAALPAARRDDETQTRQRIYLDNTGWFQAREPVPHLPAIQQAVWQDRQLLLSRRLPFGTRVDRKVDPYGLVAKAGAWYLVWAGESHIRATPLREIIGARLTDDHFTRPSGFELAAFWERWSAAYESSRPSFSVMVRISPLVLRYLTHVLGDSVINPDGPREHSDAHGQDTITLTFETFEDARGQILGLGGAVEVLAPQALRASVADFARQIIARYDKCAENSS